MDGIGWSLKYPKISSSGRPLVLKVSYRSIISLVIFTGVQCERRRRFPVRRISKNSLPGGFIEFLGNFLWLFGLYLLCSRVHPLSVPGHIRLDLWVNILVLHDSYKDDFSGAFSVEQPCARFLQSKIIWTKNISGDKIKYH